jgi:hypothetical protein
MPTRDTDAERTSSPSEREPALGRPLRRTIGYRDGSRSSRSPARRRGPVRLTAGRTTPSGVRADGGSPQLRPAGADVRSSASAPGQRALLAGLAASEFTVESSLAVGFDRGVGDGGVERAFESLPCAGERRSWRPTRRATGARSPADPNRCMQRARERRCPVSMHWAAARLPTRMAARHRLRLHAVVRAAAGRACVER